MGRRIESHWIAGPAGRLEALLEAPDQGPRLATLLCHPHPLFGGTMHNKVVHRMARGLRHGGAAVLRFNFRQAGVAEGVEDAVAALAWLRERHPALPYALAGFSFGARVITEAGCSTGGARWLLAAGFPTRMGGAAYLESCSTPKIFLQSPHDEYAPRSEFEAFYAGIAGPKRLTWIDSAGHFFAGALDALEEAAKAAALSES